MLYATPGRVGNSDDPPKGAVEISRNEYREALDRIAGGERVTIVEGEVAYYRPPVYAPDGTERTEHNPDEPLITDPPPEALHVPQWDAVAGGWVEGETDEQRAQREADELANAETQARERVRDGFDSEVAPAITEYPDLEPESWPQQEREAKALQADPSATPADVAPLLVLIANEDEGETPRDVADRVLQKASAFRDIIGPAIRKRRKMQAQIKAATTVDELEAITWGSDS